jgi:23S rRNA pseudouridine2604 synthase|tara:strand:+ start:481 stop:1206 length:726 start_codon:yes stop_codon:yes gene_type:complete
VQNSKLTRLNKFLSQIGYCSRRAADKLINERRVSVNTKIVGLGVKVSLSDEVRVDGELVTNPKKKKKFVYLIFNKPVGVECTTDRNVKNNIIDFIGYPKRIFPIGRLDKNSEGLILLTNDGDIVNKILRTENNNEKEYVVHVNKKISSDFLSNMRKGVQLKNNLTKSCKVKKINNYSFNIILTQGMNRQIRKMCLKLDYKVKFLRRIRIINIEIGSLKLGRFRNFTSEELKGLFSVIKNNI